MIKKYLKRYFVDAMSFMALGLFSSLIVGLIIEQFSKISALSFLEYFKPFLNAGSPVVGAAIGGAVAYGLKSKPLVVFSCVAVGAMGYGITGQYGPVGAFVAALAANEIASLVAGKTKIDIVVTPLAALLIGGGVSAFVGPHIADFMKALGAFINSTTQLHPFPMGIAVSTLMGLALTAPISSAAIAMSLGLEGIAAGAAAVGCSAQMIGFAVTSFKANGVGGLVSQGVGTSMLQVSNIVKHPQILIAPTLAGAVLGPISTCVLKMTNNPAGAGMGTSGLVGQLNAFATMRDSFGAGKSVVLILVMHVIAPAVLSVIIHVILKKAKIVKDEYLKLDTLK